MLDTFVQLLPELGVAIGQTFLMLAIACPRPSCWAGRWACWCS